MLGNFEPKSTPMKLKSPIVITLAILLPLIGASAVQSQYIWVPYADNPVIDFTFDQPSFERFRPAVLKKDGLIHMWYGKRTTGEVDPQSISYATSADGLEWTLKKPSAVKPTGNLGTFDQTRATNPAVISDGDTLRMWYNGRGRIGDLHAIGYAWSVDGQNWTKVRGPGEQGSVFDKSMLGTPAWGVVAPTVIKLNGVFHMWYMMLPSSHQKYRIGYARSTNGLDWTQIPGSGFAQSVVDLGSSDSFDGDQILWPWVLFNEDKGIFEMWYQGVDKFQFEGIPRLGCAHSSDGITWEKVAGNGDAGACSNLQAEPAVILDGEFYRMWYTVFTSLRPRINEVGYATSVPVSTAIEDSEIPHGVSVLSAYPNPFTSDVTLEFTLNTPGSISLQVHDILGRLVYQRRDAGLSSGSHSLIWNGQYVNGTPAPSGTYLIRLLEDGQGVVGFRTVQLNRQ